MGLGRFNLVQLALSWHCVQKTDVSRHHSAEANLMIWAYGNTPWFVPWSLKLFLTNLKIKIVVEEVCTTIFGCHHYAKSGATLWNLHLPRLQESNVCPFVYHSEAHNIETWKNCGLPCPFLQRTVKQLPDFVVSLHCNIHICSDWNCQSLKASETTSMRTIMLQEKNQTAQI